MVERVLVKEVRLVEQKDGVDAVAAEVLDVGADRVEDVSAARAPFFRDSPPASRMSA
jgi:hypothetical protein